MNIRLTEYTQEWKEKFTREVSLLAPVFGEEAIAFEHFGSTAVPGMKAKPVIDMLCVVHSIDSVDQLNDRLQDLGYEAAGEWGIEGRRLFRKGGENRSHHLHVYGENNPEIQRHLVFRDYLLAHPEEADAYSRFKQDLANIYTSTKDYSRAKKPFVAEMERKALRWNESEG